VHRNNAARILARFFPANGLALLLCLILRSQSRDNLIAFPIDALFLQSLLPIKVCNSFFPFDGNGVAWFVSATVLCSMCFPFLHRHMPTGRVGIVMALLTVMVISCVADMIPFILFHPTSFLYRLMHFLLGILLAQLFGDFPTHVKRWGLWCWAFDGALIGLFLLASYATDTSIAITQALTLPLWCIVLLGARGAAEHTDSGKNWYSSGLLIHVLGSSPFACLAKYSYGAYIYQWIPHGCWSYIFHQFSPITMWLPLLSVWPLAMLSEHVLEEPVRKRVESRIRATGK